MSEMRQAMTTWLKDECQDAGENMIYALFAVDYAQSNGYKLGDPTLRTGAASDIQNLLINATSHMANLPLNLFTKGERDEMYNKRKEIISLLQDLERPHIHETPGLIPTISDKLYEFSLLTRKLLLEKVAECQCGRQGGAKMPKEIPGKDSLIEYLDELKSIVSQMSNLYEVFPNLNDDVNIQKIVPMSLDDWELEIDAKIDELKGQ